MFAGATKQKNLGAKRVFLNIYDALVSVYTNKKKVLFVQFMREDMEIRFENQVTLVLTKLETENLIKQLTEKLNEIE